MRVYDQSQALNQLVCDHTAHIQSLHLKNVDENYYIKNVGIVQKVYLRGCLTRIKVGFLYIYQLKALFWGIIQF